MINPLVDGALDNTLGQSAYAWFQDPKNPLLDLQAPVAFQDFVDAYVHIPTRHVPLPRDVGTEVHEPFIALWQDGAKPINFAAAPGEENIPRDMLWELFQDSVRTETSSWAKWTIFQWTEEIVPAFKSRVQDWETQFEDAFVEVGYAASKLTDASDPIKGLVCLLETHLRPETIDHGYRGFALKHSVSPAVVATAYAWNWFRRGSSYRGRTHGMSVRFHDLRDRAVVSPNDGTSEPAHLEKHFRWGQILAKCIQEGVPTGQQAFLRCLKRDPRYCADGW